MPEARNRNNRIEPSERPIMIGRRSALVALPVPIIINKMWEPYIQSLDGSFMAVSTRTF